jgi:Skp family chaperone for outer membrane proteins
VPSRISGAITAASLAAASIAVVALVISLVAMPSTTIDGRRVNAATVTPVYDGAAAGAERLRGEVASLESQIANLRAELDDAEGLSEWADHAGQTGVIDQLQRELDALRAANAAEVDAARSDLDASIARTTSQVDAARREIETILDQLMEWNR